MSGGSGRLQEQAAPLVWLGFVILAVLYYAIPLFSPQASIHWDLADVSYPVQKYFADAVRARHLPYWTPYLFSGMPFLSDPAVGAWYPLHWLFFLIGITPRALVWELVLHTLIALSGAYLLARRWFDEIIPAALTAVLYGFNGFFAAHTSELGLFEAASLLPWLLWAALSAAQTGAIDACALTALAAGFIVLTGHFGAAAFSGLALVVLLAVTAATREVPPRQVPWSRALLALGAAAAGAFLIGAVVLLPWFEINHFTTRFIFDAPGAANAAIQPKALGTVMAADYLGLLSGNYKGPDSIRLGYFYGGLLAVPLALAGFIRKQKLPVLLALIIPALWYSFGPRAGFARALAIMPAFREAGAPAAIWFVVALGIAVAAGSGAVWLSERLTRKRVPYILLVLSIADLWFWNQYKNPLGFARASYTELYGRRQDSFESHIKQVKEGFYRIWAPEPIASFGPLDGSLIAHTESTWGAGLLEVNRHAEYLQFLGANPMLLNGMSITDLIDIGRGMLAGNPAALSRVTAPHQIIFVGSPVEARALLPKLNQDDSAVVEAPSRPLTPGNVGLRITGYEEDAYHVHYTAAAESLLRISVPFAPGWNASVDGQRLDVFPADYALCGVFVPGGEHTLDFRFRPGNFNLGAGISLACGLLLVGALLKASPQRAGRGPQ